MSNRQSGASTPPALTNARWFGEIVRMLLELRRTTARMIWPPFDLFVRIILAQTFVISGLIKTMDWDTAVYLAATEYPVDWLNPVAAAYLGVGIEVIGGVLLAFGLFTRFAAVALACLAVIIQLEYKALDVHVFWAALFLWYAVSGAGPLSIDRLVRRGAADVPIPFADAFRRLFRWTAATLGPIWLAATRIWLAMIFLGASLAAIGDWNASMPMMGSAFQAPHIGNEAARAFVLGVMTISAGLLAVGLAARMAVLPLIGLTVASQFTAGDHTAHLYLLIFLVMILLLGPGPLSLDRVTGRALASRLPAVFDPKAWASMDLPHVVIVGAGFGGVAAARALRNTPCRITVIDRHNYHLFQPLLYQVATAGLSPADIATPVREQFRDQANARVLLGRVTGVDGARKCVLMGGREIPYDTLVLATGARHSYFGRDDEWEAVAPGLKKIEDATEIRRRILLAFERAEDADDPAERRANLTFVIVGGGPTGVELAGAIAELAHAGMAGEFRNADPADARIVLIQSGARLLPAFAETSSAATLASLNALGVEVLLGGRVTDIDALGVNIGADRIDARTVVWAAGVIASPANKWLGAAHDKAGRVMTAADLSVPDIEDVYVIGDTAANDGWRGNPVPGLAPAAKQGGQYVAKVIAARLAGRNAPPPFRYRHAGNLATIGRTAAVADFGRVRLKGAVAWWLWGAIHVMFLAGMRNRFAVAISWGWAYITFRRSTRLITGDGGS